MVRYSGTVVPLTFQPEDDEWVELVKTPTTILLLPSQANEFVNSYSRQPETYDNIGEVAVPPGP